MLFDIMCVYLLESPYRVCKIRLVMIIIGDQTFTAQLQKIELKE
jgi:hypothetical protein